jgi:2-methylcitrate dehydratase PrpD
MTAITVKVADFIGDTNFDSIPQEVIGKAKRLILDGVGVSLAGSTEDVSRIITQYVRDMGGEPEAGVIGGGFRTCAVNASLANGTIGHALDYDDYALDWIGHPTAPVLPVILALGEAWRIPGRKALEAYILGVEVEAKLGCVLDPKQYVIGWHSTATIGTIGATAAAAKALRLTPDNTRRALGIAASMVSGLRQNFGTMTKPFQVGKAAQNGLVAALLAKRGISADESILEAPLGLGKVLGAEVLEMESVADNLGKPFNIASPGICIKLYPCCSETHRCIDAILFLLKEHRFSAQEISLVECTTSDMVPQILIHSRPRNSLEAKFSIEYCMAIALLEGEVGLKQFADDKVLAQECQELMPKVRYLHPPGWEGATALSRPQTVAIKLRDRREYSCEVSWARGSPQNPLTDSQIEDKFRHCASSVLSSTDAERCLDLILNLEQLEDMGELVDLLTQRPRNLKGNLNVLLK